MKYLVISDIHGDIKSLKQALLIGEQNEVDAVLCLGDILYHGPRNDVPSDYAPKKVMEVLNGMKEKLICVQGNCDSEVDQMVLNFPILNEVNQFYLGNRKVLMCHGHVMDDKYFAALKKGDIFIFGHIHVPVLECMEGVYMLNPGSATIPKKDSVKSVGILDEEHFELIDLFAGQVLDSIIFE